MRPTPARTSALLFLIALLLGAAPLRAQDQPPYDDDYGDQDSLELPSLLGDRLVGGYGGIGFRYAQIMGLHSYLNTARAAFQLQEWLGVGFGASTFLTQYTTKPNLSYDYRLSGGMAGLLLETTLFPTAPVHLNLPLVLGGGSLHASQHSESWQSVENWGMLDLQAFAAVEAGLELEVNVARFMRVGAGAYFRATTPVELESEGAVLTQPNFLNDFSYGLSLKFGKFYR